MPAAAAQQPAIELFNIRRLDLADLSWCGAWLLPRLVTALELPEQRIAGWLRSLIDTNENLILVQPHSVALATVERSNGLSDKPVVRERFVFVQDRDNIEHVREAAGFYVEFARWAKNLGAGIILVEELTDVSHDLIKEKLGRVFTRQQQFARL